MYYIIYKMSDSFSSISNRNYNKCKTKYILPRKDINTQSTQIVSNSNTSVDAPVPNVFASLSFPISNFGLIPNTSIESINTTISYYSCINLVDKIPVGSSITINSISTSVSYASTNSLKQIDVGIYSTTTNSLFDTTSASTVSSCIANGSFPIANDITTTSKITIPLNASTTLTSSPTTYYFVGIAFIFHTNPATSVTFPAPLTTAIGSYVSFSYINEDSTATHSITVGDSMLNSFNTTTARLGIPYFSLSLI